MRTRSHIAPLAVASFVLVAGCASDDEAPAGAAAEPTAPASTETLPPPDDPAAEWAAQVIESWNALRAANETAITEYLEVFDGYTADEVAAFRDLATHPAIAGAVEAFPEAPDDVDLAELYDALLTALRAEVAAGADAADHVDANLERFQAAAADGGADDYAELRIGLAEARDTTTQACLEIATALADRELGAIDCIEGPGDEGEPAGDPEPAPPTGFDGDAITIALSYDHDSVESEGTFEVTEGADALGCGSGTWFEIEISEDFAQATTELTCETGDRTGTMVMLSHYGELEWWEFAGGDGDFTGVLGGGTTESVETGDDVTVVTVSGNVAHDGPPLEAACDDDCPIADTDLALIEASIDAYNSGDWDAWLATISDDAPVFATPVGEQSSDLVEYDFIWSAAMNEVWTLGACRPVRSDIRCDVTIEDDLHRGLADLGLEPSTCTLTVAVEDGLVDWKRYDLDPCHRDYDLVMHAFGAWFSDHHPEQDPIDGFHYRGWNQTDPTAGQRANDHLQEWLDSGEASLGDGHHH